MIPTQIVFEYARYFSANLDTFISLTIEHLDLIALSIGIAVPTGVLLGVAITADDRLATVVIWLAGIMMTIPSIALFGLLIPVFGIGNPPVVVALVLYSQLPIIRNTYVGVNEVDPAAVEAGRGLGMSRWERLRRVQLPIALPVIMAGVRNAVVILIGIAAIGAYIGAGGLGGPIFNGITDANTPQIVVATIFLSGLALVVDYGLSVVEQLLRLRNGEEIEKTIGTRVLTEVVNR
ncbi:osmoprotectant transport system permease protein [Halorubrum ezzemoulense]|jgi:osmoprotectant transport system permease protein|uniref:Osmoprotectant transport system permease protein n=1 Tax=Halorubrum ezzemoulense TaxID=337243 RepID=A0A238YQ98_HALEZ|nr:ABC transporter permease [Halorubrum ezzemoulense]SNR72609.1 osmoprotectant transport system permease protein [Halorubrum ezzemoulense]